MSSRRKNSLLALTAAALLGVGGGSYALAGSTASESVSQSKTSAEQSVKEDESSKTSVLAADSSRKSSDESLWATKLATDKTTLTHINEASTQLGTKEEPKEPPKEEPPAGATVAAAPVGVPAPSSGWHVAYAEGFGLPLGSGAGQDPQWKLEEGSSCCGNSNEVAAVQRSQAKVGPNGLELDCTQKAVEVSGVKRNYTCAEVLNDPSFEYTYGGPETLVVEWVAKWPDNTGCGADPAVWSYTGSEEADYLEGFGWDACSWHADSTLPTIVGHGSHGLSDTIAGLGFDPSVAFHRYATEIQPSGSEFLISEYVDGVLRWKFTSGITKATDGLILVNVLRKGAVEPKFTGTQTFTIRSVAVYQDGGHAGLGVKGGGVAPGTTLK